MAAIKKSNHGSNSPKYAGRLDATEAIAYYLE